MTLGARDALRRLDRGLSAAALRTTDHATRKAVVVATALAASAALGPRSSPKVLAAMCAALVGAFLLRWPHLGLPLAVLAVGFVSLEIGTGTASSVNMAMIALGGLLGLWLVRMLIGRRAALRPSGGNAPWITLLGLAAFSVLAGGATWNPWVVTKGNFAFVQAAQFSVFALSAAAFWLAGHTLADRRALAGLCVLLLVFGAWFVVRHVTGVGPLRALRYDSVSFRVWVVALATGLALFDQRLDRRWALGLLTLAALILAVSYRTAATWQSGWIPPLVAAGAVVAVRLGRGLTRLAVAFAVPGAILLLALVLPTAAAREVWSFDTRLIAWRGLLELMPGHWLFGLGLASYWHYWRGVIGTIAYQDPVTGYLHFTFDPQVNMHNNYMDLLGQMGIAGLLAFLWLVIALFVDIRRGYEAEEDPFARAYLAAATGGLAGMLFAGLLGDWILPFVYNIGLAGLRDSYLGWMMLGGVVLLSATRHGRECAAR